MEATPYKGHLPTITKTIQVRRTRHAGHCWRSKDELISTVLPWTPSHGRAKVRRPARTYIQQLCADSGCSPEDQPGAMDDRDGGERGSGRSLPAARHDDDDDVFLSSFFYVVFESLYRCIHAILKDGESSSPSFSWNI